MRCGSGQTTCLSTSVLACRRWDDCVDPLQKSPVIIVDPRAGHGPGIGGVKRESEVGMAMREGRPVYFVIFYTRNLCPVRRRNTRCAASSKRLRGGIPARRQSQAEAFNPWMRCVSLVASTVSKTAIPFH